MDKFNSVAKFQVVGGVITTDEIKSLYVKLFNEEFTEFLEDFPNLVSSYHTSNEPKYLNKVLDAVGDMLVIQLGSEYHKCNISSFMNRVINLCINELSIRYDLEIVIKYVNKSFNEIMVSNFSKFCKTEDEAQDSVISYETSGIETFYVHTGEYWVIKSSKDQTVKRKFYPAGKILKSVLYRSPNLDNIVEDMLNEQGKLPHP